MKNILHKLPETLSNYPGLALVTLLETKGSVPQVQGASAIFSAAGRVDGTLGGGVLENEAALNAKKALKENISAVYEFNLNADITDEKGAICGGNGILLIDARPENNLDAFKRLEESFRKGKPGVLGTFITGKNKVKIERYWFENGEPDEEKYQTIREEIKKEFLSVSQKGTCLYIKKSATKAIFLQPVQPLPKLVIVGAGHIGKALSHMAGLIDFEVLVTDDRPEYANKQNLPDADQIICGPVGKVVREIPKTEYTYIVIVTHGHKNDGEALRACINADIPYIGMIGSKQKTRAMREEFIARGWATSSQFDRVHAPVGLEIGSETVQEITVSICAELIRVRNRNKTLKNNSHITGILLAAGESKRMGKPKMMLPYNGQTVIENVVKHSLQSNIDKTVVVLGSDRVKLSRAIQDQPVEIVHNKFYKNGMLSSVQCGLSAVPESAKAVMILLGDQPMIGSAIIDKMIEFYYQSPGGIIVATWHGKRGHPVLFDRKYLKEIRELPVENSLRDLLEKYPADIVEMETENPEILRDIDTEKDYRKELKYLNNHD